MYKTYVHIVLFSRPYWLYDYRVLKLNARINRHSSNRNNVLLLFFFYVNDTIQSWK